jgi:hypothetical protein
MIVNLHIERLVIDGLGVGRHEGPRIEAALTAELTRLIGEGGLGSGFGQAAMPPLIRTEPVIRPAGDVAGFGAQIGRALYGGITG